MRIFLIEAYRLEDVLLKITIGMVLLLTLTMLNGGSLAVFSTPDTINELVVHVYLSDGTPLPDAIVMVSPSMLSSKYHTLTNTTNANGTAVFYDVMVSVKYNVYEVHVNITYGLYKTLYDNTVKLPIGRKRYEVDIRLPYNTLSLNYTVMDEYEKRINGTYELYYQDVMVYQGRILDGSIVVGNIRYDGKYLLIGGSSNEITYSLLIHTISSDDLYLVTKDNVSGTIIIDLYPPKTSVNFSKYIDERLRIAWISIVINASDGVFTRGMRVYVEARWIDNNKLIYKSSYLKPQIIINNTAVYNATFNALLNEKHEPNTIYVLVRVVDNSGKTVEKELFIDVNVSSTIVESTTTTTLVESITRSKTPIYSYSPSYSNNTSSRNVYFSVPRENREAVIPYDIYFIGVIISLVVIILEVKSYRRES
jgi:hypothetical protein